MVQKARDEQTAILGRVSGDTIHYFNIWGRSPLLAQVGAGDLG